MDILDREDVSMCSVVDLSRDWGLTHLEILPEFKRNHSSVVVDPYQCNRFDPVKKLRKTPLLFCLQ